MSTVNAIIAEANSFKGDVAVEAIQKYYQSAQLGKRAVTGSFPNSLPVPMERAKSSREFGPVGFKDVMNTLGQLQHLPLSGGIDALHTFVLLNDVSGKLPGIYYINDGFIELVEERDVKPILADLFEQQGIDPTTFPVTVFLGAEVPVKMAKYKTLGYNYVLMEIGMQIQNAYLVAGYDDLKCCAFGSFDKEKAAKVFKLRNLTMFCSVVLGK